MPSLLPCWKVKISDPSSQTNKNEINVKRLQETDPMSTRLDENINGIFVVALKNLKNVEQILSEMMSTAGPIIFLLMYKFLINGVVLAYFILLFTFLLFLLTQYA